MRVGVRDREADRHAVQKTVCRRQPEEISHAENQFVDARHDLVTRQQRAVGAAIGIGADRR